MLEKPRPDGLPLAGCGWPKLMHFIVGYSSFYRHQGVLFFESLNELLRLLLALEVEALLRLSSFSLQGTARLQQAEARFWRGALEALLLSEKSPDLSGFLTSEKRTRADFLELLYTW